MNERIFYSEYFYQKGSKETDVLEKNVKEYPYSSLATFLLLYHYKKTFNPAFETLAKKTALLFNNPYWLQFQLYDKSGLDMTQEIISQENFQHENEISAEVENELPIEISSVQNVIEDSTEIKENTTSYTQSHDIINEPDEIIVETIPGTLHEENTLQEDEINKNSEETATNNSSQQSGFSENENAENDDKIIAFEPLHTVDYFASQGIKINEELLTNDKLGSQMKSFTAWLKSMKKLHPGKLEEQSLATEKLIQTSADESNINTEILTEAMAEVLIKQDKREKAIEMFSKLSLINPSKSAYFAARIESIKSH
jgi:hypothetical protein